MWDFVRMYIKNLLIIVLSVYENDVKTKGNLCIIIIMVYTGFLWEF